MARSLQNRQPVCVRPAAEDLDGLLDRLGLRGATLRRLDSPGGAEPDVVLRVEDGERRLLLRLVEERQWSWLDSQEYTDRILAAQLAFGDFLASNGVPFPRRVAPTESVWIGVHLNGRRYRAVLFEWLRRGEPISRPEPRTSFEIGRLLHRLHALGRDFSETAALGRDSLVDWSTQAVSHITAASLRANISTCVRRRLSAYLTRVEAHLVPRATDTGTAEIAQHGDLNFPNVFFEGSDIVGLVDIGQIRIGRPIEELAWVLKWYSRESGIGDGTVSPALARSVLNGYDAGSTFSDAELAELPSLLWLTGCVNANFVVPALSALEADDDDGLSRLLDRYESRARAFEATQLPR